MRTYIPTDRRTDSPCILQDFVSSGSLRSRCPKKSLTQLHTRTYTHIHKHAAKIDELVVPRDNSYLWGDKTCYIIFSLIPHFRHISWNAPSRLDRLKIKFSLLFSENGINLVAVVHYG